MEINNIMVGDKFFLNGGMVEVEIIWNDGNVIVSDNGTDRVVDVHDLKGIHVSEKLLKKLGFTVKYKTINDGIAYAFPDYVKLDKLVYFIYFSYLKISPKRNPCYISENCSKNVEYLHQLQHELSESNVKLKF